MAANTAVSAFYSPGGNVPHHPPLQYQLSNVEPQRITNVSSRTGAATSENQRDGSVTIPTRKQQGIRRACNECRQQKLRCDVVKDPGSTCSRCRRLHLVCKIDASFKRIEKRKSKLDQRHMVANNQPQWTAVGASPSGSAPFLPNEGSQAPPNVSPVLNLPTLPTRPAGNLDRLNSRGSISMPTHPIAPLSNGSEASGMLQQDMPAPARPSGSVSSDITTSRKLDGISLTPEEIRELFDEFFSHYHPFLPFLDPLKSPEAYLQLSRLLFWTIISVASRRYASDLTLLAALSVSVPRLLWSVLQSVPQNYHDIKALCLLCTWPFPISSSSSDPTFMLSGTMMNLAMQMGLHRPSQAQDFSKFTVRVPPHEIHDRVSTWYACRIVAQSVSTAYGQPSMDIFGDSFGSNLSNGSETNLLMGLRSRSRIESLCHRISNKLHFMSDVSQFELNDHSTIVKLLNKELVQLCSDLNDADNSRITSLYLTCAELHLRLFTLFESTNCPNYIESLQDLYASCEKHLAVILDQANAEILAYCPNDVFQITLACGFAVLKLSQPPAIEYLHGSSTKKVFNSAIVAIRKISVSNNDLPGRLAEVLVQLKARGVNQRDLGDWSVLQLKIRGRMSMSVLWDSLLEWRKGFEADAKTSASDDIRQPGDLQMNQPASSSLVTYPPVMQQNFNLDDLGFDDFYPMNWIIENAEMSQYPIQGDVST